MAEVFWTFAQGEPLTDGRIEIAGPAGHHLGRVLRVRPGERGVVVAGDRENQVEVERVEGSQVSLRVIAQRALTGEPEVGITLLQAVLPNPDFDAVIESGTAVGISRFIAVHAARSVARPAASRTVRWQSIAASAAEQSHRGRVPTVAGPLPLSTALANEVGAARLLVLDPMASQPLKQAADGSRAYALAVGPEGGWTEEELNGYREHEGVAVSLGPRILRARLAAAVAAAILLQQL
jgi:16S rRNA (uracil1498-N3)-methyltransferase